MIKIFNKQDCSGCSACKNVCPQGCITMIEDKEGFLYPVVDNNQCLNCNLCNTVCPIIGTPDRSNYSEKYMHISYVAFAKDEQLRLSSSSGGIFGVCAEWILGQNGVVFGAAYDKNFQVHHICVEHKKDLLALRGSKYMQSCIEDTFQQVQDFLNDGRMVLYTGTACQIAGLKGYLRKKYSNLYTLDVLCHGVPSPKVWKKYLEDKGYDSSLIKMNFRDKTQGWKRYAVTLECKDNMIDTEEYWNNPYMKMFLTNICLRPSCYACRFKEMNRLSDMTIGDAWGIEKYMPEMDDDKGTSLVIVHSDKGREILCTIQRQIVIREVDLNKILPPSSDSRKSVSPHINREKFFKKLSKGKSFCELEKCLYPTNIDRVKNRAKKILKRLSL